MPDDEADKKPETPAGAQADDADLSKADTEAEPASEVDPDLPRTMDSEVDRASTEPRAAHTEAPKSDEKKAPKKRTDKRSAQARPKKPPPPPSEAEINSPDWRTLILLAAVFLVTAISWGAAKFACNYHPPESHEPPQLATEELARQPKDAAVELMYRWVTKNYDLARELAKGNLLLELEKDAAGCSGDSCEKESKKLEKEAVVSAVLLQKDSNSAAARVSVNVGGSTKHYRLLLERDGPIWKGVSRTAEK